jgi:hypothetical protein
MVPTSRGFSSVGRASASQARSHAPETEETQASTTDACGAECPSVASCGAETGGRTGGRPDGTVGRDGRAKNKFRARFSVGGTRFSLGLYDTREEAEAALRSPQLRAAAMNRGQLGVRYQVMLRDGFACFYCGAKAGPDVQLGCDHVVPRSKGGSDDPENLVACCRSCNTGKTTNTAPVVPASIPSVRRRRRNQSAQDAWIEARRALDAAVENANRADAEALRARREFERATRLAESEAGAIAALISWLVSR